MAEIEQSMRSESSADVFEASRIIRKTHSEAACYDYLLDLFAVAYLDGLFESEYKIIRCVAEGFGFSLKEVERLKALFGGGYDSLVDDNSVVTFGQIGGHADIPLAGFGGEVAIFQSPYGLKLIAVKSSGVLLNSVQISLNLYVCSISEKDYITFSNSPFLLEHRNIGNLFERKKSRETQPYWVLEEGGRISISSTPHDGALAELKHRQAKVSVQILSDSVSMAVGEQQLMCSEFEVFDGENITVAGFEGSVCINPFFCHSAGSTQEPLGSEINLHVHDPTFHEEAKLTIVPHKNGFQLSSFSLECPVFINGVAQELPTLIQGNDHIRINSLFFTLQPEQEEVFAVRNLSVLNLDIEKLSFRHPGQNTNALENITFHLEPGQLGAIMGPAGCGKSTLLNCVMGRHMPTDGNIHVNGTPLSSRLVDICDYVGFVPQDDLLIDVLTPREQLSIAYRLLHSDVSKQEVDQRVSEVLEKVDLLPRADNPVGNAHDRTLSGGERKRLNIALELIHDPEILLLDEPTSGLSSYDSERIISQLRSVVNDGKIVLMVIHQPW